MKIKVTDIETNESQVYDYSNGNWARRYACMKNGLVVMWVPREVYFGKITTGGRKWEILK